MVNEKKEEVKVEELLQKYDLEASRLRSPVGIAATLIFIIAVAMSVFHLYTAGFGILQAMKQRAVHLSFAFLLVFLLYPMTQKGDKSRIPFYDYLLALLGVSVGVYILANYDQLVLRAGAPTQMDLVMGFLAILLVLEATRRSIGPELPTVAIIFLIYAYLGPYMPGLLAHKGYDLKRIIYQTYLTTEGIFGTPLGVSSTYVFLFILFGAFLEKTGVGRFFIDLAFALTGHMRGGPAKTAVVASGLMGSISGSSVANTVTTGTFTIPLMKSVGYKPHFAGAVEAAASTGGQIMPPVMGAAAFIMAEFTGIPYVKIIISAAIPAILYYLAVGTMVHLEACKLGLKGLPRSALPSIRELSVRFYLLLPVVFIIYFLVRGFTPLKAAYWGIVGTVIIGVIDLVIQYLQHHSDRIDIQEYARAMIQALAEGAKGSVSVAMACATAGIVVGVVTLTGLGLKVATIIIALARGNLLLTLFFTMVASIILGMGLPTTAKYIVLATMAAPALTQLGVPVMAAHLFILYFGIVADVTPPVALAAYAGAGIAGANAMQTGVTALKLAMGGFLIPYIFALSPDLLLINTTPVDAVVAVISACIGVVALSASIENFLLTHCRFYERILLFVAALALIKPGLATDAFGIVVLGVITVLQHLRRQREGQSEASV
ncbi:MAG TPA: TRAP transporter permease [Firmicutes bacterium]|jgi:TRAP transporter 4TM/12TM fusion protein|nr:TRAP transporter permease [Bacillota bacterium]